MTPLLRTSGATYLIVPYERIIYWSIAIYLRFVLSHYAFIVISMERCGFAQGQNAHNNRFNTQHRRRVAEVTKIVSEISQATSERSAGVGQVENAVDELDLMTQENAALVEESAAAADSLKQRARHLSAVVAGFQLT